MKQILKLAGIFAMAVAAVSCNVDEIENAIEEKAGIPFQIYASAEAETKTSIDDNMKTTWANQDSISVFHAVAGTDGYKNDGKYVSEDADSYLFNGTLSESLSEGTEFDWYAIYPYTNAIQTPGEREKGYVYIGGRSDSHQSQSGNNSTAHLCGKNVPLYGKVLNVEGTSVPQIQMHQLASIVRVNVTNTTDLPLTVKSVSFTGTEDIVGAYLVDISGESPEYPIFNDYVSNTATLDINNGTAINNGDEAASFYIVIKPFTAKADSKIYVAVNGYEKEISLTKATSFTAGKIKTINFNYDNIITPTIADGDYAILAKRTTGNYWFMTSDLGSATTKRYQAVGSSLSTLPASLEVNEEQIWTVTNTADGMIISAKTGGQITWSSDNSGDLAETGKKLSAKASETTGAVNISIADEPERILALNNSNAYFAFYKGTQIMDLFFVPATVSDVISYNLSVSPTSITGIEAANATKKITVTTNTTDWTATTDNSWISISVSGNTVTLTFSDNVVEKQSTSARTGKVTISSVQADKSIEVSVTQNGKEYVDPSTSTVYTLVSDLSTLKSGDVIVLGCAEKGKAAGAMGAGAFFTSVDATIADGKLTSENAIEITIGGSAGAWTLTTSEGTVGTTAAKKLSLTGGTTTWKFDSGKISSTNSSYGWIQYNASSPRFLNYTSSQTAIEVYKK